MAQTVLCIDDEPSICALHKLVFEVHGYRVLISASGTAALELLEQEKVDLVVLDYRMPEMMGDEVAEAIRRRYPKIPILMESAYTDLPAQALKNVDAYMVKGESTEKLLAQAKSLLNKNRKKQK